MTVLPISTSRVRFGHARADITPPVGIYHKMWGAATHHRASGVHRPLMCDVMAFGPIEPSLDVTEGRLELVRVQLDLVGLVEEWHQKIKLAVSEATGTPETCIVVTYSHSHAAGWFAPDRSQWPGGELIAPYLESLVRLIQDTSRLAVRQMQCATITYAIGSCHLAADRDFWDESRQMYVCGFNPGGAADDTVIVGRVTADTGGLLCTLVNYGCHPTTLAWENTLISPDYVGAMREEVEKTTGNPCVFLLGACGDLGPRRGFVGSPSVADGNGKELAYAALGALASMGPPAHDYVYEGPVVSGATLGVWAYAPHADKRQAAAAHFHGGSHTVNLPLRERPDPQQLEAAGREWENKKLEAEKAGRIEEARDAGARAERIYRWLSRLENVPEGTTFPLTYSVYRMGDAFWVTCQGEPYSFIQKELRKRFPDYTILFSPLDGDMQVGYLLTEDRYGRGLYQEEPSILAKGCLEQLVEAISEQITRLCR